MKKRKYWTEEEEKSLIELAPTKTLKELSIIFDRHTAVIGRKLNELDIKAKEKTVIYKYQIGQKINGIEIVDYTKDKNKNKAYIVKSLRFPSAPNYMVRETSLKKGYNDAYVSCRRIFEGNSLWSKKNIRKYIIDIEESKKIPPNSTKKVEFKCDICDNIKVMTPSVLVKHGIMCPKCSKGTSYPELFVMAYLEVKGIEYEHQKVFDDLPNRRFDFYLPEENTIIETHGIQHYEDRGIMDYQRTIKSDKEKRKYCKENNWTLIELDCRISEFEFIKYSINNCNLLPNIEKNKEEEIKQLIQLNSNYYQSKEIIDLYLYGFSSNEIGNIYSLSATIIRSILKKNNIEIRKGRPRGLVAHNKLELPDNEIIKLYESGLTTIKIAEIYNCSSATVKRVLSENNIKARSNGKPKKQVHCITTGETFTSLTIACKEYKISPGNMSRACKNNKSAGKHPITGEPLIWSFLND